jgi:hypothetical protein
MGLYEVEVQETYIKKIIVKADDGQGAMDAAGEVDFTMLGEDYLSDSFQVLGAQKVDSSEVEKVKDGLIGVIQPNAPGTLIVEVDGDSEFAGLYEAKGYESMVDVLLVFREIEQSVKNADDDIDKDELLAKRGIERFFVEKLSLE